MLEKIQMSGLVAVIRANNHEEALSYIESVLNGGIYAIELTYTIPNVCELITKVVQQYPKALVGVGSVLTKKMAEDAIFAGATYVVSPGYAHEVQCICDEKGIVYVPGCMTITEIMHALAAGNKMVKLFPGEVFGPKYVKAVKAPIPHVAIMPTGGVSIDNMEEWFQAGVSCVGIGSSLFASQDPVIIEHLARDFRTKYDAIKQK